LIKIKSKAIPTVLRITIAAVIIVDMMMWLIWVINNYTAEYRIQEVNSNEDIL